MMLLCRSAIIGACLLVAGCAGHAPPLPRVNIPIMRPCITGSIPDAPLSYADDNLEKITDPAERMKRIGAANFQRRSRLSLLEPVVKACR